MAVAEKSKAVEVAPGSNPRLVMLLHSALGACYLLGSLWLVFIGLPSLWMILNIGGANEFLADSLLVLVALPTIFGLFVLGKKLEGSTPVRGMRAGAFFISATVLLCGLLITCGGNPPILWALIGTVLLVLAGALLFQPWAQDWLIHAEDNLWFHLVAFKPNQGLRVRRGTVIGVMILAICGVYTLVSHGVLHTGAAIKVLRPFSNSSITVSDPWLVTMPFSSANYVFLFHITLTLPILILAIAGWFAWRLVNWPTFADFLIATEAEMNKVSWTTRKRLYQDTIVVLTTVILMTVFLFVIDIVWIKILTAPFIRVLEHDPQQAAQKNQSGAQW